MTPPCVRPIASLIDWPAGEASAPSLPAAFCAATLLLLLLRPLRALRAPRANQGEQQQRQQQQQQQRQQQLRRRKRQPSLSSVRCVGRAPTSATATATATLGGRPKRLTIGPLSDYGSLAGQLGRAEPEERRRRRRTEHFRPPMRASGSHKRQANWTRSLGSDGRSGCSSLAESASRSSKSHGRRLCVCVAFVR